VTSHSVACSTRRPRIKEDWPLTVNEGIAGLPVWYWIAGLPVWYWIAGHPESRVANNNNEQPSPNCKSIVPVVGSESRLVPLPDDSSMAPRLFPRRNRSEDATEADNIPISDDDDDEDIESQRTRRGTESDRSLLLMVQNHMVAFVLTIYGIYAFCRFVVGWTPGTPPPPSFTIHFDRI
jgi:hypothetical protein